MKTTKMLTISVVAFGLTVCLAQLCEAEPMGTAFTYQGRLIDANDAADGLYDFKFRLFDDPNVLVGTQVGDTIDINELDVIDGYFTVGLDFNDANSFNGDARWLEIGVRPGELEDPNAYTPLMPRQEVTPTPYAIYAKYAEAAGGDGDWMVSGDNMYSIPSGTVSVGRAHDAVGPGLKVSRGLAPPWMGNTRTEIDATSINAYFTSASTSGTALKLNDDSTGNVVLAEGGGDVLLAEGGGNVGIGTSSPQEKLDVDGPINTDSVYKIAGSTVLSTLGASNTFVGIEAGANNTEGYNNTFLGKYTGHSNTEGYYNTFSGNSAGYFNTKGYRNTFLGNSAGYRNTEGNFNTFLGNYAGRHNSTGNYNTFSGNSAGYSNTTGAGNVFIGYRAGYNETGDNKLYIANSSADPPLIYGDFSTGRVGIGTISPNEKLHVSGDIRLDAGGDIAFADDNTRIHESSDDLYLEADDDIYISPDDDIRMDGSTLFVDGSANRVGIGTTSPSTKLDVSGTITATGGNSDNWNTAYRWGNHASSGYLTSETDPQVGTIVTNYLSKWNGSALVTGTIYDNGDVGIGTINPQGKLDVNGSIYQRGSELHADYVFNSDYELESIDEHSEFMWQNKHLSAIPKAKVDDSGQQIVEVGAHRRGIVEELEKAHIYIEQLHKRVKTLEEKLIKLEAGLNAVQ